MARPVKARTDYGNDINRLTRLRAAVKKDERPNNEDWRKKVDSLIFELMELLLKASK